jgi:hypothetical protein
MRSTRQAPLAGAGRRFPRLGLERLEDRTLLSNYGLVPRGLDVILQGLEQAVDTEIFGITVPIVGQGLNNPVQSAPDARFLVTLDNALQTQFTDSPPTTSQGVVTDINNALNALGLSQDCTFDPASGNFSVPITQNAKTLSEKFVFDTGLPNLNLSVNAGTPPNVQANVGYTFTMTFGATDTDVYITTPSSGPLLNVSLDVTNPNFSNVNGQFGKLGVQMSDEGSATSLTYAFTVTPANAQLFAGLAPGTPPFVVNAGNSQVSVATGSANINLHISTVTNFPTITTDFALSWNLDNSAVNASSLTGQQPVLYLNNVGVDLGGLLSSVVAPAARDIIDALAPISGVIDVLNTRLPIISDLLGDTTVANFLDFALNDGGAISKFVSTYEGLKDLLQLTTSGRMLVSNVSFAGYDPRSQPLTGDNGATPAGQANPITDSTIQSLLSNTPGLTLPILQDGTAAANALLSKDGINFFDYRFGFNAPQVLGFNYFIPVLGPWGSISEATSASMQLSSSATILTAC